MVDLGLQRPDKGQPCAHYVCSVSAGSRGSETLKGRVNVLTRGFQKEMLLRGEWENWTRPLTGAARILKERLEDIR